MHILFVTPYVPSRIRVRPFEFIKALSAFHEISLVSLLCDDYERALVSEIEPYCASIDLVPLSKSHAYRNCLRALPTLTPLRVAYYQSPTFVRRIEEVIQERSIDLVHGELIKVAPTLRTILTKKLIPVLFDSVDCISGYLQQQWGSTLNPFKKAFVFTELQKMRRYEGRSLKAFEQIIITSTCDKSRLEALGERLPSRYRFFEMAGTTVGTGEGMWGRVAPCGRPPSQVELHPTCGQAQGPHLPPRRPLSLRLFPTFRYTPQKPILVKRLPPIEIVPNGVDLEYFTPLDKPREKDSLVFCAKLDYEPNVQAICFFCREMLPIIWKSRPEVTLTIVGNNPPGSVQELAADKRILVTGYVPDIRPYLGQATVALAPLLVTAGMQNKVLEALAMGTPMVATPGTCSALNVAHGTHLLIAEEKEDFAEAVLQVLSDPQLAQRLGQAGRAYVEQAHSWLQSVDTLDRLYQSIVSEHAQAGSVK